jgi:hypothetical protein
MTNKIQLFTESVSQMGIPTPECKVLTDLAKACLESALYDNYDEENPEYDNDLNIIDGKEEADDVESMPDPDTDFDTLTRGEERDDIELDRYRQENIDAPVAQKEVHESTVGTKLANTYIQVAPKLLDSGKCTPSDVDNLYSFIDWIINQFNDFNPEEYLSDKYTSNSYDESRLDKTLSVIDVGPAVVQLLEEIKDKYQSELESASLTNESAVFSIAKDLNFFVGDMFNNFADDAELNAEQEDTSIGINDKGFIDDEKVDAMIDARDGEEVEDEPTPTDEGEIETTEDKTLGFPNDTKLEEVEKAVNDFIEFVPTIGLSDSEATALTTVVDDTKKKQAKKMANKRAEIMTQSNGAAIESGRRRQNPWANKR